MTLKRGVILTVVLAVIAALGVGLYSAYQTIHRRLTPEVCTVTVEDTTVTLSREQAANASIIVAASVARDLPRRAAVIALMTAYQESGLRNLDYGDRDSLGLFQQRPSYGWGTEEEIMDPWYSSNRFYEELEKFDNWEEVDLNDMAQKVQRSGYPDAYGKHAANSIAVAKSLLGEPASISCTNFTLTDASPDEFAAVLEAIDAEFSVDGTTVTITGDKQEIWSATNLAMANSYASSLSRAEVLGYVWTPTQGSWQEHDHPSEVAVLSLGED